MHAEREVLEDTRRIASEVGLHGATDETSAAYAIPHADGDPDWRTDGMAICTATYALYTLPHKWARFGRACLMDAMRYSITFGVKGSIFVLNI
jgi:hypothetical protein